MRLAASRLVLLCIILALPLFASAKDVYVAIGGSDSGPGTKEKPLDCRIHHVGRLDWMNGRGVVLNGCGNRMANNLIHHGPTGAVAYGGNEHILELNYIHDISNNAGHGSSAVYSCWDLGGGGIFGLAES